MVVHINKLTGLLSFHRFQGVFHLLLVGQGLAHVVVRALGAHHVTGEVGHADLIITRPVHQAEPAALLVIGGLAEAGLETPELLLTLVTGPGPGARNSVRLIMTRRQGRQRRVAETLGNRDPAQLVVISSTWGISYRQTQTFSILATHV